MEGLIDQCSSENSFSCYFLYSYYRVKTIALLLSGIAESSITDPFDRPIQLQINKKLINSISAQFLFLEKLKTEEKY